MMNTPPEGITVKEEEHNLKIIYKYNLNLKAICMNLACMSLVFIVIWIIHLLQHQSVPFFVFPVLFIAICLSLFLTSISSRVIEINNTHVTVCQKPLAKNSPAPIALSDIENICYEPEPLSGIFRIYALKLLLKNSKKITIVKTYPDEEEHIKFIQSVIRQKLGLEGRERKSLHGM